MESIFTPWPSAGNQFGRIIPHSELVSTSWALDTIPRQAPSVKMAGIQHGLLVSSVKKRTRTTCRALLNPRLGVTGSQQVDLRSLWTMKVLLKNGMQ
jgi:hypothetical protein